MYVKGTLIKSMIEHIKSKYGENSFESFTIKLSPESQKLVNGLILPVSKIDKELFKETNKLADEMFGKGDGSFFIELGKQACTKAVMDIYKKTFENKLNSIEEIISSIPSAVMPLMFEGGKGESEEIKNNSVILRFGTKLFEDKELMDIIYKRILGWIEELLVNAGKEVLEIKKETENKWDDGTPYFEVFIKWQ